MYGYVYLTENLSNGMKFIGERRAVLFDPKFLGDNESLLADVQKLGPAKFSVKMLMPYESEKALVAGKEYWLDEYKGSNLYNSGRPAKKTEAVEDDKPKRTRKKKEDDE